MKKFLYVLLVLTLCAFIFTGCEEEATEQPNPPTNLTIAAGGDGLSLILTWTAPSGETVEEYIVYFEGTEVDRTTNTQYTFTSGEVTALGDYEVTAIVDGEETDATNEVSTELDEGTTPDIYDLAAPVGYNSGFGWNSNGDGATYSMAMSAEADYADVVHFYLDTDGNFYSSDTRWASGLTTYMKSHANYDGITTVEVYGSGIYGSGAVGDLGSVFYVALEIDGDYYYAKCRVSEEGTSPHNYRKITFGFQKISGFRRLG